MKAEVKKIDEPVVNRAKEALLRVEAMPRRETEYSQLYLCQGYMALNYLQFLKIFRSCIQMMGAESSLTLWWPVTQF